MNKAKKISIVLIIIILIVGMFTNKTYAVLNCNVNLSTSKDKVAYNEQFVVYVTISNLQTTKGIIALGGVLSYDTDSLTLIDIKGENNWSDPFVNSSNGKFTSLKNKLSTSNENVFKITFEVNEKGKAGSSAWISINNFEISDGDEENNCGGNSINIAIAQPDNGTSGSDNQGGNDQSSNSGNNTQGGNNQSGNSGNNTQGGNNQGSNSGNTQTNRPNTGTTTTKPPVNTSTNEQDENINNEEIPNENNNNVQNNVENNTETKENKKMFYIISIASVILIILILFLIIKFWKIKIENKELSKHY